MYDQHMATMRGEKLDEAFFFIQQAFSIIGDRHKLYTTIVDQEGTDYAFDSSSEDLNYVEDFYLQQNVTFNIWLFKGEHHFVQCTEHLNFKYGMYFDDQSIGNYTEDPLLNAFDSLCKDE